MTFPVFLPGAGHHPTPFDHPERMLRIPAAVQHLAGLTGIDFRTASPADIDALPPLHGERYLAGLRSPFDPGEPPRTLDGGDTVQTPGSLMAALEGVGAAMEAVDEMAAGTINHAFVATRPPGHHACRDHAMGFCLLGTAALAAAHARNAHGQRVVVLDFDVHHGNGTQDLLSPERDLFFGSTQASDLWPFTASEDDTGLNGNVMNIQLPRRSGDPEARAAWTRILAWVEKIAPDLIIVSAGFDAHADDPLGILNWSTDFYGELGHKIQDVADLVAGGRVLSILEGGYDLGVLNRAIPEFVAGLLDTPVPFASGANGHEAPGFKSPAFTAPRPPAPIGGPGFSCIKAYSRLWIQDNQTGDLVYTIPGSVRINSRRDLQALADRFTAAGHACLGAILEFEAAHSRTGRRQ